MFQLHDRTRRQLCVLGFFVTCLVPTAIVLAYGVAWHLPGHARQASQRLSGVLGLKVSLQTVEHLRPGVVRYEGLQLTDTETQKVVFRCRRVEISTQTIADEKAGSRECLVLAATEPSLEAEGLKHAWRLLQDLLARRIGDPTVDVRLSADRLIFPTQAAQQAVADLRGWLRTSGEAPGADVTFRLPEAEASQRITLRIVRSTAQDAGSQDRPLPGTVAIVQTGTTPLPCSLLTAVLPWTEPLLPSQFRGSFAVAETADGWEGGLEGEFQNVDLQRLFAGRFSHTLTGPAHVSIERAQFRQGRLQQATGAIVAGPGDVSRSLLDATSQQLGLVRGPDANPTRGLLPYQKLGLWFSLDDRGLTLRGLCPPQDSGVILADHYGPLVSQPEWQPQPVAALVRALVSPSDSQVPATRETDGLLRCLPLPGDEPKPSAP